MTEIRISDAERDAAVTALGEHYAAGRLTKDEYDERASQAYAARTASALRPLFVDLPAPHPGTGPATGPGATGQSARTTYRRPGRSGPGRTRRGLRLPLLPILLVLVGAAILIEAPWLVFVGLGVVWLARGHRSGGCGYAKGRERPARGSWV
jgi:hypothetical protein